MTAGLRRSRRRAPCSRGQLALKSSGGEAFGAAGDGWWWSCALGSALDVRRQPRRLVLPAVLRWMMPFPAIVSTNLNPSCSALPSRPAQVVAVQGGANRLQRCAAATSASAVVLTPLDVLLIRFEGRDLGTLGHLASPLGTAASQPRQKSNSSSAATGPLEFTCRPKLDFDAKVARQGFFSTIALQYVDSHLPLAALLPGPPRGLLRCPGSAPR